MTTVTTQRSVDKLQNLVSFGQRLFYSERASRVRSRRFEGFSPSLGDFFFISQLKKFMSDPSSYREKLILIANQLVQGQIPVIPSQIGH